MLNKKYLSQLRKELHEYALQRQEVIRMSNEAIYNAKRAIFDLHRDNLKEAELKLKKAEGLIAGLNKKHKSAPEVLEEGAYKAALEEFVEAKLFYDFFTTGKIGEINCLPVSFESYLAGLCDVPGELLRYAIKSATNRDIKMVKKCAEMAQEIIGELIEFDLTSYLRTKFDQAKQAVRKLEEVVYEVSLRK